MEKIYLKNTFWFHFAAKWNEVLHEYERELKAVFESIVTFSVLCLRKLIINLIRRII